MNKVSSNRSNPSNMESIENTKKAPASENESKKIFIKKGSTTIFQKFLAKLKGIKQAPTNAKLKLAVTTKVSGQLSNIKDTGIVQKGFKPPPTDDARLQPATDIDLDNILNELKGNSPDDEMDVILNEFKKDSPHNKLDAILNELHINIPDGDLDKNLEELKILIGSPKDPQLEITKNDIGLPPPTDDIGPPPPNYIPDPPSIKQIHISNLERAMDLGGMNFDENRSNYEQLNRQKEIVETTIKQIASASTLKKSERINEGRGSLSNLKLELKREFQSLMIMAKNNGYRTDNWIKRTADLDSALRSIDFIQEKKSSWF